MSDLALAMPDVDGVQHRFVDVEGIRLHVAEAGEGEPLLMLHGWPQNWFMWRHLVPALGGRYRLLMPDLRGFGWSDAPASGYGTERLATDDRCMHAGLLRGYEGHALDMTVELVPVCGHFIVDEKPELVAARAQEFFRD